MTILGVLTAIILFAAELRHYTTPHEVQTVCSPFLGLVIATMCVREVNALINGGLRGVQMSVDMNKNMFLRVHFNMTFHALPCHGTLG